MVERHLIPPYDLVWACFAAFGVRALSLCKDTMTSEDIQSLLKEAASRKLSLSCRSLVNQQD